MLSVIPGTFMTETQVFDNAIGPGAGTDGVTAGCSAHL